MCAIAAAALAVCVLFCLRTNTGNAARMEAGAVAVSSVAGWVIIYLLRFRLAALRHEETHERRMLAGGRETLRGHVTIDAHVTQIPRSIAVRRVTVESEGRPAHLFVDARHSGALEHALGGEAKKLELDVVGGYVAAFTVCDETA